MYLKELFQPKPDETAGQTMLRSPLTATLLMSNQQRPVQLPKGTVVILKQKLPQKRLVLFSVNGKQHATTENDWNTAIGL